MTSTATKIRFVREGKYFAEVAVDIIEDGMGWSPGLTLEGAEKLERVRAALRAGRCQSRLALCKGLRG